MEQIKQLIQKIGPMRLGILILCGVFLMVLSWDGGEREPMVTSATEELQEDSMSSPDSYKQTREEELRNLLQKVEGVGDVEVMITLKESNETEGIVIVCEGGYDSAIKREITEAVGALFSIDSHKIKIMKSKEAKE